MFNLLVSFDGMAWESRQRIGMDLDRFLEYSGDESDSISASKPQTLKALEHVKTLLMYEELAEGPDVEVVRVGQLRDIRKSGGRITFRFVEEGRLTRLTIREAQYQLQMDRFEFTRTHWAVKDGEIPQDVLAAMTPTPKSYDVVLSFAGEDREYVERVVEFLESRGIDSFYDGYEEVTLWGKDLVEHFDGVYRKQGRFCVMFISRHYAEKTWTRYECRAALSRALEQRSEYVLPVRFDNTEVPGLPPTIGYLDISKLSPEELGERILRKLGRG